MPGAAARSCNLLAPSIAIVAIALLSALFYSSSSTLSSLASGSAVTSTSPNPVAAMANPANLTQRVLTCWFRNWDRTPPVPGPIMSKWFARDDQFDQEIKSNFESDVIAAGKGAFDDVAAKSANDALAVAILLDQFPRNAFRGTAQAFAFDQKAREIVFRALDAGFDAHVHPVERQFFYLVLMHHENLESQQRCVQLEEKLSREHGEVYPFLKHAVSFAKDHANVIERFGRFPSRNAVLGRESTAEEKTFLESHKGW
ncbi:hypothetical protein CAOG_08533 [Capsaspora owczarzaki ATCC 30864]|uniref:DUF924-domain-containing protein n=1 Tax=Capsaspora owczarzaki (strain ATCC 30864) TaxID=595528 RepID=A0A0D2U596_CAPO3|nr:hypothetical protein CAOG_08533 [Capsaspora owczarzaki ATCC 30864]KJE90321.1 hypothetical protein CAOG_008533 [Capsaspora owczarzaki ATCC 30864]|eukprot:XP_011270114.1 hypothetical protein CAOG_08533 [Capsaspora owczarzaki ATCC 30864]